MRGILAPAPADLVDFLLDLKRLEIVKLGLVRLELCVEPVFAALALVHRASIVPLKQHDAPTLVTGGEVVARLVELDGRDNVGLGDVVDLTFVAKALRKAPAP